MSNAARYTEVVVKFKEYGALHFRDQATVAVKAMEELKVHVFTKKERPVWMYWSRNDKIEAQLWR